MSLYRYQKSIPIRVSQVYSLFTLFFSHRSEWTESARDEETITLISNFITYTVDRAQEFHCVRETLFHNATTLSWKQISFDIKSDSNKKAFRAQRNVYYVIENCEGEHYFLRILQDLKPDSIQFIINQL